MEDYVFVPADARFRSLLEQIFTEDFMCKNTNFKSFEAFKYSSAVITNWNADQMVYSKILLDGFVRESTRFTTWDEMVIEATDEKFQNDSNK